MSYSRKWIPPTIPYRDDLAAWKTLFQDLHDSILLAGLVQTDTPGQLVIQDVEELPPDNAYAGFIEYAFNDPLQSTVPVVIRLDYGCGIEGLGNGTSYVRSRTPRVKASVSVSGVTSRSSYHPQGYNRSASVTSQPTALGLSTIHYDSARGVFGIVYGAESRNKPHSHSIGSYYGSTLTLFVARDSDSTGAPTADGVVVLCPDLSVEQSINNLWTNGALRSSITQFITPEGAMPVLEDMARPLGGLDYPTTDNGTILTQGVYYTHPTVGFKQHPWVVSYINDIIPSGTEFDLEVFPGTPTIFTALGNETGLSSDSSYGQRVAFAMKYGD